jgi:hypothetical protein
MLSSRSVPRRVVVAAILALGLAIVGRPNPAAAQDTREEVIAAAQAAKESATPPDTESKAEHIADLVGGVLTPKAHSFFPYFDSVYSGGGFTLGAGYGWLFGDHSNAAIRGLYSIKNYKLIEAVTTSSQHLDGKLTVGARVGWRDAPEAAFYGLGMETTLDDRANFNLREGYGDATATLWPSGWTMLAGSVGVEGYTIKSGKGDEPSIEEAFTPAAAPGLGTNPTYVHSQATAAIDWRTSPGYSRKGGYYGLTLHDYSNTNGVYDFNRLDATLIQHVPVLRETWVLSFRGDMKTTLGDDLVPYFLLPSLGSGSTLRAYHSWRFRDRHSLLMSGEFRWIPSRLGMDMAIFYDAGKVASRREDLNFVGLEHDWGVGMRLHGPTQTPLRIEVSRGSEGWHLTFSGAAAF